jgi:RimJ/RimL family protein N-acetyltransferase
MMAAPSFTTSTELHIRPFQAADAAAFAEAALESVGTVGRWLPWCHANYSLADAEQWVQVCARNRESGTAFSMGIFSAGDGALLGGVGINHINREHNFANVGYWIRQSRQGRGIAPVAVRMIAEYGFQTIGLTRLEIVVQEGNHASQRVAEKSGAAFEGVQQNRLVVRGQPFAAAMYALTPA